MRGSIHEEGKVTSAEVWVAKPELPKSVVEQLVAYAQEYGFVLWVNGERLWPKEKPNDPKERESR